MLRTFKQVFANQYEAVFCTLNACIDNCPASAWDGPVVNHAFCQVAFHALFYADYYLGENPEAFRGQPFHRDNQAMFRDYEELEDRKPFLMYDKASIRRYLAHCRKKAAEVIAEETVQTLEARCGFEWLAFSRGELHVYNIRHLQHHAGQLILRLRRDFNKDVFWVKSGWRET